MKLYTILEINFSLKRIIDNKDLKINPSLKFKLLGIMKDLSGYVSNFELIRDEKICEYGTKDESGNVSITPEDKDTFKLFKKDIDEVLSSDVKVNIQKVKPTDLFDKGIPSEYLIGLYEIIEE